jgi:hypothetical protein
MKRQIKKTFAILLAVCFVLLLTATSVTALMKGPVTQMNVVLKNDAGVGLNVIVAFYDPNVCHSTYKNNWHVKGWVSLAPGESKEVFTTKIDHFYYYAEDTVGAGKIWRGTKIAHIIRGPPIDQCINIVPQGSETIGLARANTNGLHDTYTFSFPG